MRFSEWVGGVLGGSGETLRYTNQQFVLRVYVAFLAPVHLFPLSPQIPEHNEACPFNFRDVYATGQEAQHVQTARGGRKTANNSLEPSTPTLSHCLLPPHKL